MKFSEKLKACRKKTGLTQSQVADQLHVSRKTISGWENAHSFPDSNSLIELSNIYKISVDALLKDDHSLKSNDTNRVSPQKDKWLQFSFRLNFFLIILGYIDYFRLFGMHTFLIPIILLSNDIVFLSRFSEWSRFNTFKIRLLISLSILGMLLVNIGLNLIDPYFLAYLNQATYLGSYYLFGVALGRLVLVLVLTLDFVILAYLNPTIKQPKIVAVE